MMTDRREACIQYTEGWIGLDEIRCVLDCLPPDTTLGRAFQLYRTGDIGTSAFIVSSQEFRVSGKSDVVPLLRITFHRNGDDLSCEWSYEDE